VTLALGLMSGTSGDGVSAAVADFVNRRFRLLAYETFPYPPALQRKLLRAHELKAPGISKLDFLLGRLFAEAALKIIKCAKLSPRKIRVIGSHGQTIYHGPRDPVPSTFQIGEAAVIAERTGIPVASDFRPQDIAQGGVGAPLIPFFDSYFYGKGPVRALLNIGGIANVTIAGKNLKKTAAFDTGPGNCLIDLAVQKISKGRKRHDSEGRWAGKGKVNRKWLSLLLRHPYFLKSPPKSTGREEFGEKFLNQHLGRHLGRRPLEVLATLTYFTAVTIFEGVRRFSPRPVKDVIVSGGGVKNLTLMRLLREFFAPVPVRSIEALGIPAQAKEPVAFAFLGLRAFQGEINHLPEVTGAGAACVLGKITRPHASY